MPRLRAGRPDEHGLGGDVPRPAARARRDRPPPRDQVPGLLPRLARLGRHERDLAGRPRGAQGSALDGHPLRGAWAPPSSLPYNDLEAVAQAVAEHPGDIAAIILEPIPHNIGAVLPVPGFLEGLRELCTREGIVLVFDEVITGFRHAVGGYQSIVGVTPDLTTVGKAMANGYPIGAIGGPGRPVDQFSTTPGNPVFFAGTFNGHPAVAAAALATIAKLEREPVHEHIFALGDRIRRELTELYARLGVPAVVSGFGSVFVSYFVEGPVDVLRRSAGERRRAVRRLPARADRMRASSSCR